MQANADFLLALRCRSALSVQRGNTHTQAWRELMRRRLGRRRRLCHHRRLPASGDMGPVPGKVG